MSKTPLVDVYNHAGRIVYTNMIDDPSLSYLHWGNGHGFVDRYFIKQNHMEVRPQACNKQEQGRAA